VARDWRPSAALSDLRARAAALARIREFFAAAGVLEVTTPVVVARASAEPALASIPVGRDGDAWLRTSPEAAMKRLLASGSGDIYQIGPAFRADERGRLHLPEFTLLEWYRVGFDHVRLMDEVEALLRALGWTRAVQRLSCRELCVRALGLDPHTVTTAELAACVRALPVALAPGDDADRALLFDALHGAVLEPALRTAGAVLLHGYPQELRAYARLSPAAPPVAERFELIVDGIEIANGYHEIVDPDEQAACFAQENAVRARRGLPPIAPDAAWLDALRHGLPACAGVALGIERLLLALGRVESVAAATAFAHECG
jgi:lysyl-tRNA synthetase class 2